MTNEQEPQSHSNDNNVAVQEGENLNNVENVVNGGEDVKADEEENLNNGEDNVAAESGGGQGDNESSLAWLTVVPIVLVIVVMSMSWAIFNRCDIVGFARQTGFGPWKLEPSAGLWIALVMSILFLFRRPRQETLAQEENNSEDRNSGNGRAAGCCAWSTIVLTFVGFILGIVTWIVIGVFNDTGDIGDIFAPDEDSILSGGGGVLLWGY